jgi:hypothetical protein
MKKTIILAAATLVFASCGNNGTKSEDERALDSMSQVLMRQHIIDSMNEASAASHNPPEASGGGSYSHSESHTYSGHSAASAAAAPNAPSGPTYADYEAQRKADKRKKARSAAIGAGVGAGVGALGGALSNKDPHFKKENAAIGAGVGAALGAGAALLLQNRKLKRERDTAQ